MNSESLISELDNHDGFTISERNYIPEFLTLIKNNPDAYHRSRVDGHMTASAWVVDPDEKKVLLLHHTKLKRWLQPGGHADGNQNLIEVARKELIEETGLNKCRLYGDSLFDLDIHVIPSNVKEQSHRHYDVRYLFVRDAQENPIGNHESKEVRWVSWDDVSEMCQHETSILRMLEKTTSLFLQS